MHVDFGVRFIRKGLFEISKVPSYPPAICENAWVSSCPKEIQPHTTSLYFTKSIPNKTVCEKIIRLIICAFDDPNQKPPQHCTVAPSPINICAGSFAEVGFKIK